MYGQFRFSLPSAKKIQNLVRKKTTVAKNNVHHIIRILIGSVPDINTFTHTKTKRTQK